MSRTYKDKKWSLRYPENDYRFGTEKVAYIVQYTSAYTEEPCEYTHHIYVNLPGSKKKKKRRENGDWKWCESTPSWFVNTFMTRPKRRACSVWERQVLFQDIEDADCPDYGRKPHVYYY